MAFVRIYRRNPPQPVALLLAGGGQLVCAEVFSLEPILERITGAVPLGVEERLLEATEAGYVFTEHDPDDSFFRDGSVLTAEQVLILILAPAGAAGPPSTEA